jgi:hypothetical protein
MAGVLIAVGLALLVSKWIERKWPSAVPDAASASEPRTPLPEDVA